MLLFLGIDQSLSNTGLALVDEDANIVKVTVLSVAGKLSGAERLHRIVQDFRAFMHGYVPAHGALEGFSVNSTNRPFDLGEVSGILRMSYFELFRKELMVVPPMSLKKFAGVKGTQKELMVSTVKSQWGLESDNDNIADAVALAQMARAHHLDSFTTRAQREAVTKTTRKKPARLRHRNSPDNV